MTQQTETSPATIVTQDEYMKLLNEVVTLRWKRGEQAAIITELTELLQVPLTAYDAVEANELNTPTISMRDWLAKVRAALAVRQHIKETT